MPNKKIKSTDNLIPKVFCLEKIGAPGQPPHSEFSSSVCQHELAFYTAFRLPSFANLITHPFPESLDGPELVTKTQDPADNVLKKGSNLTLSCSASSSPAAEFIWLFNGAELPQNTATLVLSDLEEKQSGNYSCMAFNSKTQRYVTSDVTTLSVLGESFDIHVNLKMES